MNNDHTSFLADVRQKLTIEEFNPMQQAVLEAGLAGRHLTVLSPTGSGKTIAFLTVLLNRLNRKTDGVTALVLVPSRELALQIESVFRSFKSSHKVTCCYGGHSAKVEQQSLTEAPALLIATPGRLVDHLERGFVGLQNVDLVVLDEFDKLLQMGFEPEMRDIFSKFGGNPQVMLTSATAIDQIPDFVKAEQLSEIDFRAAAESKLELHLVRSKSDVKLETLVSLVAQFNQEPTLVFCNHREAVERISGLLKKKKFEHGIFHGALEQIDREKNLIKFRSGAHNVLVATDLASRGLDIPVLKHVVHYQLPVHQSEFLHRNGRTARMDADGAAYLILADDESLPEYLGTVDLPEFRLDANAKEPPAPTFACLYISAGKKDKLSKGDILGFLTQGGGLAGEDIGLISVLDRASYVAVKRTKLPELLAATKTPRIKKMKVRMALAN